MTFFGVMANRSSGRPLDWTHVLGAQGAQGEPDPAWEVHIRLAPWGPCEHRLG
jgi:hypothetical protein